MKTNQLKTGVRIESEHKKTIRFIKRYVTTHKKFPSNTQIYKSIAKDHLKEHKNYYTKLKKAKL
jgi:sulfur relay (sulfurtransferase) DsrC/TusE family protein